MTVGAGRVIAIVVGLALAASCSSGRSDFSGGSVREVERGLEQAGLVVCSRLSNTDGLANQATKTTVLNVGIDCHEELVAVVIDTFDAVVDRDAAARSLEVQTRPRRDGVVWTFGPHTIAVFGPRDHELMRTVIGAMDQIDAR